MFGQWEYNPRRHVAILGDDEWEYYETVVDEEEAQ
jgi:serine kinase of HPr protein (carbohydrate metabolism regulator)